MAGGGVCVIASEPRLTRERRIRLRPRLRRIIRFNLLEKILSYFWKRIKSKTRPSERLPRLTWLSPKRRVGASCARGCRSCAWSATVQRQFVSQSPISVRISPSSSGIAVTATPATNPRKPSFSRYTRTRLGGCRSILTSNNMVTSSSRTSGAWFRR